MDKIKTSRGLSYFGMFLALLFLSLLSTLGLAADYPLEIIQPRPNLNTQNRFYKAYPGLEYNVRLAVIGGEYPFTYSLDAAPSGMTIDKNTGEISWSSPAASSTPYNVTATVTDSESSSKAVSWTVIVTTSGFKFVDALAGSAGDGSISSPWKTLADVANNASSSDFIYFRNGTYVISALANGGWDGGSHPVVWMAYPGESPVFDLQSFGFFITGGDNKLFVDGITFNSNNNTGQRGISFPGGTNITFRRNVFYGLNNGTDGANPSYLFSTAVPNPGNYLVVQDNEVTGGGGPVGPYFLLTYTFRNVLVEDNHLHNFTGEGISPKDGGSLHFIRGNHIHDVSGYGIRFQGYNSRGAGNINNYVSFNRIHMTSGVALEINTNGDSNFGVLVARRNTLEGRILVKEFSAGIGPYTFVNNVIINGDSSYTDRIYRTNTSSPSPIIYQSNLSGSTSANIVDVDGNLTAGYSEYIGKRGYQVGNPISAPTWLLN